ncbi:hypothetical protein [Haloferula sp.]|uniref:hypothetical protein n=1 Tax=Haloferula sp. TaxID=2497595 RepID=UPI003C74462E
MQHKPTKPYLSRWLHRTRKQLAISGRLTETAMILSQKEGRSPDEWSRELRSFLDGNSVPTLDLITTIDTILAKPRQQIVKTELPLLI